MANLTGTSESDDFRELFDLSSEDDDMTGLEG
ncbi:MAG: hypothetical protein RLZZ381_3953, partial [Cyanobacteriota bacterium]